LTRASASVAAFSRAIFCAAAAEPAAALFGAAGLNLTSQDIAVALEILGLCQHHIAGLPHY